MEHIRSIDEFFQAGVATIFARIAMGRRHSIPSLVERNDSVRGLIDSTEVVLALRDDLMRRREGKREGPSMKSRGRRVRLCFRHDRFSRYRLARLRKFSGQNNRRQKGIPFRVLRLPNRNPQILPRNANSPWLGDFHVLPPAKIDRPIEFSAAPNSMSALCATPFACFACGCSADYGVSFRRLRLGQLCPDLRQ